MRVNEVEPGRGSPVPQQARLDVLDVKGLRQQRIGVQVNLSDRQIIRRSPMGVNLAELLGGKRVGCIIHSLSRLSRTALNSQPNRAITLHTYIQTSSASPAPTLP